jgi:hypothetical protein
MEVFRLLELEEMTNGDEEYIKDMEQVRSDVQSTSGLILKGIFECLEWIRTLSKAQQNVVSVLTDAIPHSLWGCHF